MRIAGLLLMSLGIVAIAAAFPAAGGAHWDISVISALFVVAAVVAGAVLFGCGAIAARLPPPPVSNKLAAEILRREQKRPLELRDPLPPVKPPQASA